MFGQNPNPTGNSNKASSWEIKPFADAQQKSPFIVGSSTPFSTGNRSANTANPNPFNGGNPNKTTETPFLQSNGGSTRNVAQIGTFGISNQLNKQEGKMTSTTFLSSDPIPSTISVNSTSGFSGAFNSGRSFLDVPASSAGFRANPNVAPFVPSGKLSNSSNSPFAQSSGDGIKPFGGGSNRLQNIMRHDVQSNLGEQGGANIAKGVSPFALNASGTTPKFGSANVGLPNDGVDPISNRWKKIHETRAQAQLQGLAPTIDTSVESKTVGFQSRNSQITSAFKGPAQAQSFSNPFASSAAASLPSNTVPTDNFQREQGVISASGSWGRALQASPVIDGSTSLSATAQPFQPRSASNTALGRRSPNKFQGSDPNGARGISPASGTNTGRSRLSPTKGLKPGGLASIPEVHPDESKSIPTNILARKLQEEKNLKQNLIDSMKAAKAKVDPTAAVPTVGKTPRSSMPSNSSTKVSNPFPGTPAFAGANRTVGVSLSKDVGGTGTSSATTTSTAALSSSDVQTSSASMAATYDNDSSLNDSFWRVDDDEGEDDEEEEDGDSEYDDEDDDDNVQQPIIVHAGTPAVAGDRDADDRELQPQARADYATVISVQSIAAVVPLCTDMCPESLRNKYLSDNSEDKFEKCVPGLRIPGLKGSVPAAVAAETGVFYKPADLMVKRLIKSSADHSIQIPEQIRTPSTLLRTIRYLEEYVMDADLHGPDPRFPVGSGGADFFGSSFVTEHNQQQQLLMNNNKGDIAEFRSPTLDEVYFFCFDRMRMVAKDFILQSSGANGEDADDISNGTAFQISPVWIECHERIARYYIIMDNYMRQSDVYLENHAEQNKEQMNNVFKTLIGYYTGAAGQHVPKQNRAEFTAYYLFGQLGNKGEVTKYLRTVPRDVLASAEFAFLLEVWGAYRRADYAQFFKMLKKANLLQACMMRQYVSELRLSAIKKLAVVYCPPGRVVADTPPVPFPLNPDLVDLLMFEDLQDCLDFLHHCRLPIEGNHVLFLKQQVTSQLPVDKNGDPVAPWVRHMEKRIDAKRAGVSLRDACRGLCSIIGLGETASVFPDEKWLDERAAADLSKSLVSDSVVRSQAGLGTTSEIRAHRAAALESLQQAALEHERMEAEKHAQEEAKRAQLRRDADLRKLREDEEKAQAFARAQAALEQERQIELEKRKAEAERLAKLEAEKEAQRIIEREQREHMERERLKREQLEREEAERQRLLKIETERQEKIRQDKLRMEKEMEERQKEQERLRMAELERQRDLRAEAAAVRVTSRLSKYLQQTMFSTWKDTMHKSVARKDRLQRESLFLELSKIDITARRRSSGVSVYARDTISPSKSSTNAAAELVGRQSLQHFSNSDRAFANDFSLRDQYEQVQAALVRKNRVDRGLQFPLSQMGRNLLHLRPFDATKQTPEPSIIGSIGYRFDCSTSKDNGTPSFCEVIAAPLYECQTSLLRDIDADAGTWTGGLFYKVCVVSGFPSDASGSWYSAGSSLGSGTIFAENMLRSILLPPAPDVQTSGDHGTWFHRSVSITVHNEPPCRCPVYLSVSDITALEMHRSQNTTDANTSFETKRLFARPLQASDSALVESIWCAGGVSGSMSVAQARERLQQVISTQVTVGISHWLFFLKTRDAEEPAFVGLCALTTRRTVQGTFSKCFELTVQLHSKFWRMGFGTEMTVSMVERAFDMYGCDAVFATHHPDNIAAAALLAKCGFESAGLTHDLRHPSYILRQVAWSKHSFSQKGALSAGTSAVIVMLKPNAHELNSALQRVLVGIRQGCPIVLFTFTESNVAELSWEELQLSNPDRLVAINTLRRLIAVHVPDSQVASVVHVVASSFQLSPALAAIPLRAAAIKALAAAAQMSKKQRQCVLPMIVRLDWGTARFESGSIYGIAIELVRRHLELYVEGHNVPLTQDCSDYRSRDEETQVVQREQFKNAHMALLEQQAYYGDSQSPAYGFARTVEDVIDNIMHCFVTVSNEEISRLSAALASSCSELLMVPDFAWTDGNDECIASAATIASTGAMANLPLDWSSSARRRAAVSHAAHLLLPVWRGADAGGSLSARTMEWLRATATGPRGGSILDSAFTMLLQALQDVANNAVTFAEEDAVLSLEHVLATVYERLSSFVLSILQDEQRYSHLQLNHKSAHTLPNHTFIHAYLRAEDIPQPVSSLPRTGALRTAQYPDNETAAFSRRKRSAVANEHGPSKRPHNEWVFPEIEAPLSYTLQTAVDEEKAEQDRLSSLVQKALFTQSQPRQDFTSKSPSHPRGISADIKDFLETCRVERENFYSKILHHP